MTMAKKLRDATKDKKDVKLGFFLHTAFRSRDFLTILPKRETFLQGLLSCDLVGFHTAEYEEHFRKSCESILQVVRNTNTHGLELTFGEANATSHRKA